jgi:hypothetical protein
MYFTSHVRNVLLAVVLSAQEKCVGKYGQLEAASNCITESFATCTLLNQIYINYIFPSSVIK